MVSQAGCFDRGRFDLAHSASDVVNEKFADLLQVKEFDEAISQIRDIAQKYGIDLRQSKI